MKIRLCFQGITAAVIAFLFFLLLMPFAIAVSVIAGVDALWDKMTGWRRPIKNWLRR